MLMFSFVACSSDDDMAVSSGEDIDYISVDILLATGGSDDDRVTRATPDKNGTSDSNGATLGTGTGVSIGTEAGTSYDNYIDPNDVTILVFEKKDTDNDGIFDEGEFIEKALISGVEKPEGYTEDDLYATHAVLLEIPKRFSKENATYGYTRDTEFQLVALCNQGINGNSVITSNLKDLDLTDKTLEWLIDNLTYSGYIADFTSMLITGKDNHKARIPMFGTTPSKLIPAENETTISGVVMPVLRAMAKVRVKLDISNQSEKSIYKLAGVSLNTYNANGYMAATGNADATDGCGQAINKQGYTAPYEATYNGVVSVTLPANSTNYNSDTHTGIVHPSITGSATSGTLDFSKLKDGTTDNIYEYVLYVPEYRNITQGSNTAQTLAKLSLAVQYADGTTAVENATLHFADYTGKTSCNVTSPQWDIIRNDIYDYTITSITPTGGLKANVRVMPWEYEKMEYELTQAPVVTIGWSDEWPVCYDGINYGMPTCYEESSYGATFYVDVSVPEGVKWQARLTNPLDFEFDPDFDDHGYGGVDETNGYNDYYGNKAVRVKVKVRPKSSFKEGARRTTNLYFILETLVGDNKKATIKWWADNPDTPGDYKTTTGSDGNTVTTLEGIEGNGPFPMLGDTNDPPGEGKMVRIVQIAESEWEGYRSSLLDEWKKEQYEAQ